MSEHQVRSSEVKEATSNELSEYWYKGYDDRKVYVPVPSHNGCIGSQGLSL